MPELRKVIYNPADHSMGYKVWSNGLFQPIGAAPGITHPDIEDGWAITNPVWDLQIINWAIPSGYFLTDDGEIRGFGGVVDPGVHGHIPTYDYRIWRWMFMNPNGDGSGYMFMVNGPYDRWGPTAPVLPIGFDGTVPDYHQDFVRDVALDWTTKKWAILGRTGQVDASFQVTGSTVIFTTQYDVYRGLVVRDWSLTQPRVLVSQMSGWLYTANSWGSFSGQPVEFAGRDVISDLRMIHDGSGGQPMELALAARSGAVYRWFVSDPPTSTWTAPANSSTVTTTTRPTVIVGWNDPDGDAIVNVDVRIFGPNVASITNPTPLIGAHPVPRQSWSVDARTTGFVPDFDLENGTWQGFVRVKDAATDVSAWTKSTWTQNVSRPPTPTLADPLVVGHHVELTVSGTTNTTRRIYIEHSDDGTTWVPMRDANPGPSITSGGVDLFDFEAPFNTVRSYRARVSSLEPPLSSLWTAVKTADVYAEEWTLLKVSDHTETVLSVLPGPQAPTPTGTGVFSPLVGTENIVLTSGWRHGDIKLKLHALTKDDRLELVALSRSGETFLLRNPFGEAWYVRFTGDVVPDILRATPLLNEQTPIRDARVYDVTLTPVRRPSV